MMQMVITKDEISIKAPLPRYTLYEVRTYPFTYSHMEGGEGQPVRRLEGR